MEVESKRVFISDLPQTITEEDIREKFSKFGSVTSIEVKERRELGPKNKSYFFSFVNIDINHRSLDQCFQEFSKNKWKGHYVEVQLAKESFLDRLKRERQESHNKPLQNENKTKFEKTVTSSNIIPTKKYSVTPKKLGRTENSKYNSLDSSSSSSESEEDEVVKSNGGAAIPSVCKVQDTAEDVYADMVVKNNKHKKANEKIESFGAPIATIERTKKPKSMDPKRSEADQKRLNSMLQMKKGYQNQKSVIKAALASVDLKPKNKTTIDEIEKKQVINKKRKSEDYTQIQKTKKSLFDEDGEVDDEDFNFEHKKQFDGKKGQKLLELQSRYKNDNRFQMDERFAEEEEEDNHIEVPEEEEKNKQLEILGEVLGRKFMPKQNNGQNKKTMLRFDPSQPEHSKFEISEAPEKKKRKVKEAKEPELLPEVSEEKFYQVTDTLKDAFQEVQPFSLLNMFGRSETEEAKHDNNDEENATEIKKQKKHALENRNNPFKYDSSDEEDEKEEVTHTDKPKINNEEKTNQNVGLGPSRLWTETFFFKDDDYRFQEGIDFIRKLEVDSKEEFGKIRRDLKVIVQAKVKNNLRKNKPFKKKLGGNSRRKMIRVKKALKR